jgi:precorrin-6B methylase 2
MSIPFSDIRKQVGTLQVAERFFDSLLLFTLFDLGIFRQLASGPRGLEDLAQAVGGHAPTLRAVLDASVATGLLQLEESGQYSAQTELQACLADEHAPAYLGEWLTFLGTLVAPVSDLAQTVRTGRPSASVRDGSAHDNRPAQAMTAAMDAYARTRGIELAHRLDLEGVGTLLDIGCGPGTYSLTLLEQHPGLHAILLDLPGPIAEAREHVAARGLEERVTLAAADAFDYEPEREVDLILVSNILHMLGPERSQALLVRCGGLVRPGGRLVVQAEFLNPERTAPRWATLLNLIMQATTEGGRNHALDETEQWMRAAGFDQVEHQPLSPWNVNSLLVGVRTP